MSQTRLNVTRLLRRDIAQLKPYPAPQPLEEFARDLGVEPTDIAKLDQNENPYGCSPRVVEALAKFGWYHVYPDPEHRVLRERLAAYTGSPVESIVVGNGSDELIELLLRLCVDPGDRVVSASPTFGYYATAAQVAGAEYVTVPRGAAFELDVALIAAAMTERTKLILVASPNNPTGNATSVVEIKKLLELDAIVVVDEAYFEFCGQSAIGLLADPSVDNLVVLRTFSKWAGLAGLRLGYGIFPAALLSAVNAIKAPYSVNQAAEVAGLASIDDIDYLRSTVARILLERERMREGLESIGWLKPHPSDANFLLCDVVDRVAAEVQQYLAGRGILVRRYSGPHLENSLRISVGRPDHTDRLTAALRELTR
jgi:histidinol-phosphate aminotransferase